MPDNPNAEIIAIGTELLLGETNDTNSVYIARQLRDTGINLYTMTTVGDNLTRISSAISAALQRAEVIITTGGLGPTVDDMTRPAVAEALGRELEFQQKLLDGIAARFRGFGAPMTANNRQQAYLPQGAIPIHNPVGTAPAFAIDTESGILFSLPGVPREMKYLLQNAVLPMLQQRYQLGIILARTLRTAGIGESALDDAIGEDLLNTSNPSVGLAAHHGCVDLRITAKAASRAAAAAMLDGLQQRLQAKIGKHIYGIDDVSLEDALHDLVVQGEWRVHVVEAGLPGIISKHWRDQPSWLSAESFTSPQAAFAGYQLATEQNSLQALAQSLAQLARRQQAVDASLVLLCAPQQAENADSAPASAVALCTAHEQCYRVYGFGAQSPLAREWMPRWGLANLWRMLQ